MDEARTFGDFQTEDWNPLNWFSNSNKKASHTTNDSDNKVEFEALFKILECLSKNERKDCVKLVDAARSLLQTTTKTFTKPTVAKSK